MNTPILFLLGAVALSALGGLVVWIASRPRPEKFGSSIDTFNRDLNALAPPGSRPQRSRRATRPASHQAGARNSGGRPGSRPSQQQPATAQARPKPGPRPGPRS